MGGDVKESLYNGFMESFDATQHHVNAAAVRSRLEGSTRDAEGRFRVAAGSSTLRAKEMPQEPGISLAALEKQVLAEKLARKLARKQARQNPDAAGAAGETADVSAKRQKTEGQAPAATHSWLRAGLVVKVTSREPPELHKAKGSVVRVVDAAAEVEFSLDSTVVRRTLPVTALETVIPKPGGPVVVVSGAHDGATGTLVGVDIDSFCAQVALASGTVVSLPYEHVCKTTK